VLALAQGFELLFGRALPRQRFLQPVLDLLQRPASCFSAGLQLAPAQRNQARLVPR
jgi:hypothetical protein